MGGTQSTGAPAPRFKTPQEEVAYQEGKEEATKDIQAAFSAVAAQVYDGVHGRLEELQTNQLSNSSKLSNELKEKLAPYTRVLADKSIPCVSESEAVTACLIANKGAKDPLVCSSMIEVYAKCAAAANIR